MNLLVQNALSNINDMMDQFDPEAEDQEAGGAMGGQSEEKAPISFIDEPSKFTHNNFINALGNTAVAMLLLLCSKPHDDMVARLRDSDSEHRRCHTQYSKTLEALKLHYSDKSILLASDYDIRSDMAGTIIQFVNLTQLGEWLLDGSFDSICEADRNLPKVFRDERLGLTQNIVNLMMGIKTQRLIKTVQSKEDKKLSEEELQGIFLESAEKQLEEHGITNLVHGSDKTITSCLSERVEELRNLTAETNIIGSSLRCGVAIRFTDTKQKSTRRQSSCGRSASMLTTSSPWRNSCLNVLASRGQSSKSLLYLTSRPQRICSTSLRSSKRTLKR